MTTLSNAQQGTRGLSAGDWIRLKRLQGARSVPSLLVSNKDIAPPQFKQLPRTNGAIKSFPTAGSSKYRRSASSWTEYRASETEVILLQSQVDITSPAVKLTSTRLCDCKTLPVVTKQGICTNCSTTTHVRIM